VAERDWGFEVGVTTSSGPSDVTSEIAGDDHKLQSRWLVGAQVWGWGGGVYIPLANNRQRRQIAKRSRARKKEDIPKEASRRRQGPGGAGGDEGREREGVAGQGTP